MTSAGMIVIRGHVGGRWMAEKNATPENRHEV